MIQKQRYFPNKYDDYDGKSTDVVDKGAVKRLIKDYTSKILRNKKNNFGDLYLGRLHFQSCLFRDTCDLLFRNRRYGLRVL